MNSAILAEKTAASKTAPEKPRAKGDISFEIGYGKEKFRFDLKFIDIATENEIHESFNNIADSDERKAEKEFELQKQALVQNLTYPADADLIAEKFSVMDVKSQRIIRSAYYHYRSSLQPDITF